MFLNLLWITLDQKYAPTLSFILDGFEEGMASVFRALIQIRKDRELEAKNRQVDNGHAETKFGVNDELISIPDQNPASGEEDRGEEEKRINKLENDKKKIWKQNGTEKHFQEFQKICRKRSKEFGMILLIR